MTLAKCIRAIVLMYLLLVRFPTRNRVNETWEDQILTKQYFLAIVKERKHTKPLLVERLDLQDKIRKS